jgi:hypothetical protein
MRIRSRTTAGITLLIATVLRHIKTFAECFWIALWYCGVQSSLDRVKSPDH